MKCTECGSRIEKKFYRSFFVLIGLVLIVFCGFLIFAPIQLFFVGVIVILIALTQIEKRYFKDVETLVCEKCGHKQVFVPRY